MADVEKGSQLHSYRDMNTQAALINWILQGLKSIETRKY